MHAAAILQQNYQQFAHGEQEAICRNEDFRASCNRTCHMQASYIPTSTAMSLVHHYHGRAILHQFNMAIR